MTNPASLFTDRDYRLAQLCLAALDAHSLTEAELRACAAIIAHHEYGAPISEDEVGIARHLLDALVREQETAL